MPNYVLTYAHLCPTHPRLPNPIHYPHIPPLIPPRHSPRHSPTYLLWGLSELGTFFFKKKRRCAMVHLFLFKHAQNRNYTQHMCGDSCTHHHTAACALLSSITQVRGLAGCACCHTHATRRRMPITCQQQIQYVHALPARCWPS